MRAHYRQPLATGKGETAIKTEEASSDLQYAINSINLVSPLVLAGRLNRMIT